MASIGEALQRMIFGKSKKKDQRHEKRHLQMEPLEERHLLAVGVGGEIPLQNESMVSVGEYSLEDDPLPIFEDYDPIVHDSVYGPMTFEEFYTLYFASQTEYSPNLPFHFSSIQNGLTQNDSTQNDSTQNGSSGSNDVPFPTVEGVYANTYMVDTLSDVVNVNDGVLSLREAIALANASADKDLITFAGELQGTITLTSALPAITDTVDIIGDGLVGVSQNRITIDGNQRYRIFYAGTANTTLTLAGLDLVNGKSTGGGAVALEYASGVFSGLVMKNCTADTRGGAIYSASSGSILIDRCTIEGNSTGNDLTTCYGGALYVLYGGDVTIRESTFTNNSSARGGAMTLHTNTQTNIIDSVLQNNTAQIGGGIYTIRSSSSSYLTKTNDVVLDNTQLLSNTATQYGGGAALLYSGNVDFSSSTFRGNSSGTSIGGGVYFFSTNDAVIDECTFENNTTSSSGGAIAIHRETQGSFTALGNAFTITNSTLQNNTAAGKGGGIYSPSSGNLSLFNTTISGNKAETATGQTSVNEGGGIYVTVLAMDIRSTTITNNKAYRGGGLHTTTSTPTMHNTIIAGNTAQSTAQGADIYATLSSTSTNNLIGIATGMTGSTNGTNGNQIGTAAAPLNAKLGPLQNNGGKTWTHALLVGSPAINAGNNAMAIDLIHDQRGSGYDRIVDDIVDIGAYEWRPASGHPSIPDVPIGLSASSSERGDKVTLTWTVSANATQYEIYRCIENGQWTYLNSRVSTNYIDTNVVPETTYHYRVVAVNTVFEKKSEPSNVATVTTPNGIWINLGIDTFNTSQFAGPVNSEEENLFKNDLNYFGKIIQPNYGDRDGDGVLDIWDGYNGGGQYQSGDNKSEKFVPIVITLPYSIDLSKAKFQIDYWMGSTTMTGYTPGSPPRFGDGTIRIWNKDGDKMRSGSSISSYGNLVMPMTGELYYTASQLGFTEENREVTLYVEGHSLSSSPANRDILVAMNYNHNGQNIHAEDRVRYTTGSVNVDMDIDSDNSGAIDHSEAEDRLEMHDYGVGKHIPVWTNAADYRELKVKVESNPNVYNPTFKDRWIAFTDYVTMGNGAIEIYCKIGNSYYKIDQSSMFNLDDAANGQTPDAKGYYTFYIKGLDSNDNISTYKQMQEESRQTTSIGLWQVSSNQGTIPSAIDFSKVASVRYFVGEDKDFLTRVVYQPELRAALMSQAVYNREDLKNYGIEVLVPYTAHGESVSDNVTRIYRYGISYGIVTELQAYYRADKLDVCFYVDYCSVGNGTGKELNLVFQGTDFNSWDHWTQNIRNGLDDETSLYDKAKAIGRFFYETPILQPGETLNSFDGDRSRWEGKLQIIGHSLGGGLAATVSMVAQNGGVTIPTTVFNAAGLNNTIPQGQISHIIWYYSENDFLTRLQTESVIAGFMPQIPLGVNKIELDSQYTKLHPINDAIKEKIKRFFKNLNPWNEVPVDMDLNRMFECHGFQQLIYGLLVNSGYAGNEGQPYDASIDVTFGYSPNYPQ